MNLYESSPNTIDEQIEIWETIKKENIYYYYGRREGYKNFGLQPIPALTVSEYKAKEAIQVLLLLKSLKNSEFGSEEWTLVDTNAELLHTPPKNAFKKKPYTVNVYFDNDPRNSFPYTNWDWLYIQDDQDNWYKTPGLVDENGLYFEDPSGDKNYFVIFASDAPTYGTTGQWTVHYKNETISNSALASTSQESLFGFSQGSPRGHVTSSRDAVPVEKSPRREENEEGRASPTTTTHSLRSGRRRKQGEPTTTRAKRRRVQEELSPVSPGQVGRRYNLVPTRGLTRLERLTEEARDPPVLLIKGAANTLKCWRWRCRKSNACFKAISTVFNWINDADISNVEHYSHRMLIVFASVSQRTTFLNTVTLPSHTAYSFGNLNSM